MLLEEILRFSLALLLALIPLEQAHRGRTLARRYIFLSLSYLPSRRLPSFAIALSYSSEVYLKILSVEGLNLLTAGS